MVQNLVENQLYLAAGKDKSSQLVVNKFIEYNDEKNEIPDDEELFSSGCSSNGILLERLVLNCVPIPGLSPWLAKKLNIPTAEDLKGKKIIVYDYKEQNMKVSQERMIVGLAYETNNEIVIHSWHTVSHYTKARNHEQNKLDLIETRSKLLIATTSILKGDRIAAEYIVLLLTSQVFSRVGTHCLGKLSLNLIDKENEKQNVFGTLKTFLNNIVNYMVSFEVNVETLNKSTLIPRYDANTEELNQGILQTLDHTLVFLDETKMASGKLDERGVVNHSSIKELIDLQMISYEYPYSKIEIHHDTPILIVSDSKSIFDAITLLHVNILFI